MRSAGTRRIRATTLAVTVGAVMALGAACTELVPTPTTVVDGAIAYEIHESGTSVEQGGGPVTMTLQNAANRILPNWVTGMEDYQDLVGTLQSGPSFVGAAGSYPIHLDYDDPAPSGGLCGVYFCGGANPILTGISLALPDGSARINSTSIEVAPTAPAGTCDVGETVSRVRMVGSVTDSPTTTVTIDFWICGGMGFYDIAPAASTA